MPQAAKNLGGLDYDNLAAELESASSYKKLLQAIVDTPFHDKVNAALLGLGIVALLLVNKRTKTVDRITLSNTEQAEGAVRVSVKGFREIKIPIDYGANLTVQAIKEGVPKQTDDWRFLFAPSLTPEEARFNQAGGGIGCSFVYPLIGVRNGGALHFSYFLPLDQIGPKQRQFMKAYSSLAAEKLQKK